jgi:hypothetical protein
MELTLLPDLERRKLIAAENPKEVTYSVIEHQGFYARVLVAAPIGSLFILRSTKPDTTTEAKGIVTRSNTAENVCLLMLDKSLPYEDQPYVAAKLDTEYFKVSDDDPQATAG